MYHSVTEDATRDWGPWRYAVTPAKFEEQISAIDEKYNVVTIDDVLLHIRNPEYSLPRSAAVVTFDDGYEDTLTQAVPVLERYGIPATIYVSTSLLGDEHGPFEFRLAEALRNRSGRSISLPDLDLDLPDSIPGTPERAYRMLRQPAKWTSSNDRNELLSAVEDGVKSGIPMLNEEDVQELSEHRLVTIGAHGHSHVPLTTLTGTELMDNIGNCATILRDLIGKPIKHFSYPYGAYDEIIKRAVQNSGMMTSVTTAPTTIPFDDIERRQAAIPRIDAGRYPVDPRDYHFGWER